MERWSTSKIAMVSLWTKSQNYLSCVNNFFIPNLKNPSAHVLEPDISENIMIHVCP